MVAHSGAPLRFDRLRPLNRPVPVHVLCDREGVPVLWRSRRRDRRIARIVDRWRIDDEWWRSPLQRLYYLVELEEGEMELFYHDLVTDRWYRQKDVR